MVVEIRDGTVSRWEPAGKRVLAREGHQLVVRDRTWRELLHYRLALLIFTCTCPLGRRRTEQGFQVEGMREEGL